MNIELENKLEKKAYVAPSMEILSMGSELSLLSGSAVDVNLTDTEYDDELN